MDREFVRVFERTSDNKSFVPELVRPSSASVGSSQWKVGVKSVTIELSSGLNKAKSPGRSFSVFTLKL